MVYSNKRLVFYLKFVFVLHEFDPNLSGLSLVLTCHGVTTTGARGNQITQTEGSPATGCYGDFDSGTPTRVKFV